MRLVIVVTLLLLGQAVGTRPATAQERGQDAAQTDQTVAVSRGARLALEGLSGTVTVRAWDKESVRVQARHSSRARVTMRNVKSTVSIQSESTRGTPGRVDYTINVPAWMPVSVEVTFDDITIEGTESDVSAETVRGNITIRGGAGSVRAESVEGRVIVQDAKARVEVSSVNDFIQVDGAIGAISADTTNGAVTLTRIQSSMVEASTVNGSINFDGTIADDGHYGLTTHNGDILVAIPPQSNVTFDVRTYQGRFSPDLPVSGSPPSRRGGHAVYTLGSGSAQMELESFGGTIRVRDAGAGPRPNRQD